MIKSKFKEKIKLTIIIIIPLVLIGWYATGFLFKEIKKTFIFSSLRNKISVPFISQRPKNLWLSTQGNRIVNEKGEVQILRGVNVLMGWGFDSWNAKAVTYAIKDWNVKIIRSRVIPQEYLVDPHDFFYKLEDQIVGPARKLGVYVILYSFTPLSTDDLPNENSQKMWLEIAKFYKEDPIVLYDLIPEPHNTTKERVKAAYMDLIPKVRQINPKSLIFVTGLGWGREINSYISDPIPFDNIVYRSNPYNKAAEFEGLFGKIALQYPVFLGEFGDSPDMPLEAVQAILEYSDKLGLGWTAWNFHSIGCPCLLDNWQNFNPSEYGQIVLTYLKKQPNLLPLYEAIQPEGNELIIYDDNFNHGFIEQGWDREVDLQNQEKVLTGNFNIKWIILKAGSGLSFKTVDVIDPGQYNYLEFAINFNTNKPFPVKIVVDDSRERPIGELVITDFGSISQDGWYRLKIPFKNFGITEQLISAFGFIEAGQQDHALIYLDEIKLSKM